MCFNIIDSTRPVDLRNQKIQFQQPNGNAMSNIRIRDLPKSRDKSNKDWEFSKKQMDLLQVKQVDSMEISHVQ